MATNKRRIIIRESRHRGGNSLIPQRHAIRPACPGKGGHCKAGEEAPVPPMCARAGYNVSVRPAAAVRREPQHDAARSEGGRAMKRALNVNCSLLAP